MSISINLEAVKQPMLTGIHKAVIKAKRGLKTTAFMPVIDFLLKVDPVSIPNAVIIPDIKPKIISATNQLNSVLNSSVSSL